MPNAVCNFLTVPHYDHAHHALILELQLERGALVTQWSQSQLDFLRQVLRGYERYLYTHRLIYPLEAIAHAIAVGSVLPALPLVVENDEARTLAVEDIVSHVGRDRQFHLSLKGRDGGREVAMVFSPEQAARLLFYIESDCGEVLDPARAIPTMARPAWLC